MRSYVNMIGFLWNILFKLRVEIQKSNISYSFLVTIRNILHWASKEIPSIQWIVWNIKKALKVCWITSSINSTILRPTSSLYPPNALFHQNLTRWMQQKYDRAWADLLGSGKWRFSFNNSCWKPLVFVWIYHYV